jgi:DNA-binding NtrC family response regulator
MIELLNVGFPGIVGRSPAMVELFGAMARVAASDVAVHVFGETGTGKELVARGLHAASPRRAGPFVALNASSLSDELFEARCRPRAGAFTGGPRAKDRWRRRRGHAVSRRGRGSDSPSQAVCCASAGA